VDFENIQKIDENIINSKTKVIVMVGLDQNNKAFDFARNLFTDISSVELIKVNGRGPNALDIFIAFYIGRYFDSIKESEIIIYSNDTDYDQLIKHLDGYGISIKRICLNKYSNEKADETKVPKQKKAAVKQKNGIETDDTRTIIEFLQRQTESQKSKRPKKLTTLENYLYTHFSQKISIDRVKIAISYMEENKYIIIINNKIDYNNI
jgi:hypothetical protein